MKGISILILTLLLLTACNNKKISDEIIIEGQVKNIPDGKVYLTEAHAWQIPLDSTESIEGHFVFKIKTDSSFVPYMASISYPDSSSWSKVGLLMFSNDFLPSPDTSKFYNYGNAGFYLEMGITIIEDQQRVKQKQEHFIPVTIQTTGRETEVMYKNQFADFGWLGNIDSAKRLQRITFFEKEIKKYPFSYFLLQSIFDSRAQYSKEEIKNILSLFSIDVQNSGLGNNIETYLLNRPDPKAPYPNLSLLNSINRRHNIIDTSAKLNMLVFWASWCGPCREEIPVLKEIEKKYNGKGLNLISISMDDSKANWEKAMSEEKMIWPQYIVDKDKLGLIKTQFNFAAIPVVVFTDKNGIEIKKFVGYEKGQEKNYEAVINKYIDVN